MYIMLYNAYDLLTKAADNFRHVSLDRQSTFNDVSWLLINVIVFILHYSHKIEN